MENSWCSSPNKVSKTTIEDDPEEVEMKDDEYQHSESQESSSWTEILADYSDYVRGLEADDDEVKKNDDQETPAGFLPVDHKKLCSSSTCFDQSDSMASDAGSNPEWKQMIQYNTTLRKLNFKSKRLSKEVTPYDDSLEDTASSPVNSPKITMGLKRMDLNARRSPPHQDHNNSVSPSFLIGKGGEDGNAANGHQMETVFATQKQYYYQNVNTNTADSAADDRNKMMISYQTAAAVQDCANIDHHELQKKGLCLVPVSMLPDNFINYNFHIG